MNLDRRGDKKLNSVLSEMYLKEELDQISVGLARPSLVKMQVGKENRRVTIAPIDNSKAAAQILKKQKEEIVFAHAGCVSTSAFLNNELIVTGGCDNNVILWHIGAWNSLGKIIELKGHSGWITAIQGTEDGKWILTASEDKTVKLWNLERAMEVPAVIENMQNLNNLQFE